MEILRENCFLLATLYRQVVNLQDGNRLLPGGVPLSYEHYIQERSGLKTACLKAGVSDPIYEA